VDELLATIRSFMKEKIGPDYEKYLIITIDEKHYSLTDSSTTPRVLEPVDTIGSLSRYMNCKKGDTIWPWGSYNYAVTYFVGSTGGGNFFDTSATRIGASVSDEVTPEYWTYNSNDHEVTCYGSLKSGLFPPAPSNLVTGHHVETASMSKTVYEHW
jgi:hypothetical protein